MKQPVRRRQPSQARARTTQLLIFETAARILEEEGLERLNTNRLAERSGFSVGTIYQYFANKQAIVQALMRHEQEKMLAEIRKSLMTGAIEATPMDASPRVRAVVRAILGAFGGRQRARKILIERALQLGQHRSLEHPLATLTALLTSGSVASDQGGAFTLTEIDAFVLTQAVAGAIRAALARDRRLLKQIAFEDALVGLIDGFPWNRSASSKASPSRSSA
jgi:AcrR family transcriptional regulator